jgi:hypothetical protein
LALSIQRSAKVFDSPKPDNLKFAIAAILIVCFALSLGDALIKQKLRLVRSLADFPDALGDRDSRAHLPAAHT